MMLRSSLFGLLTSILTPALATQVPLKLGSTGNDILVEESHTEWNLHTLPLPNDTDHLIFETVSSLLQRWPNTRMRNGK